jgi:hypothetical protein
MVNQHVQRRKTVFVPKISLPAWFGDLLWECFQARRYTIRQRQQARLASRVLDAMSRNGTTTEFQSVVVVLQETLHCQDLLTLWQRNQL